jgi:hypothetical protein
MAHISQITDKKNINISCPDGFANQLRLALAGVYLKMTGCVDTYNIEWVLNNHNNVQFTDYFTPLPGITFEKIDYSSISHNDVVDTCSLKAVIESLSRKKDNIYWEEALKSALHYLQPKPEIQDAVDIFVNKHNITNSLGLHVRRTCKTAILKSDTSECRSDSSILSNEDILDVCSTYDSIYLATDNNETQTWFREKLASKKLIIYSYIKTGSETFNGGYNRNNVTRYTDSIHTVMDFLILKQCKTFLGTSESSFSLLLKYWRNNSDDYPITGRL